MPTPESLVKNRVKALFKKYGAYYHMPVQNGMGSPTLDFIACYHGYFIAVETKAGKKRATPRQEITMDAMRAAGAFVFLVNEVEGLAELEETLVLLG